MISNIIPNNPGIEERKTIGRRSNVPGLQPGYGRYGRTSHTSGRPQCGPQWSARRTHTGARQYRLQQEHCAGRQERPQPQRHTTGLVRTIL